MLGERARRPPSDTASLHVTPGWSDDTCQPLSMQSMDAWKGVEFFRLPGRHALAARGRRKLGVSANCSVSKPATQTCRWPCFWAESRLRIRLASGPLSAVIAFVIRRSRVPGVLAASMPEMKALLLTRGRRAEEPLRPDVTMLCCGKVPRQLDGPRSRVEFDSYLDGLICDDMA